MEVLAGVVIGVLITLAVTKKPIEINLHKKIEEVRQPIIMPDIATEMSKAESKEDKVYAEDMRGLIDDINNIMLGGSLNVEEEK